ncbi:MAG: RpiB/LacA/LacB family sugar-phosphate isomerase [Planctomycetota bacterium]|nr:RpiB/LacA/LacB family sugar-phosphate isomerase [Planctomycetota bacterium]
MDRGRIESLVRAVLRKNLGAPGDGGPALAFVSEREVMDARAAGTLIVAPGAIVTPLARDAAASYGVTFVEPGNGESDSPRKPVVALGADHGGVVLKDGLKAYLEREGWPALDLGTHGEEPVDYPDFAHKVAGAVARGEATFGIVVDGVGVGSCMAANRHAGVRAALGAGILEVTNAREHNDANVLCLGGRTMGDLQARAMVTVFLMTEHAGGRHARRVRKIETA